MRLSTEGMKRLHQIARDRRPPTEALKRLMRGEIVHRPKPALTPEADHDR